jgi:hypothetical protein
MFRRGGLKMQDRELFLETIKGDEEPVIKYNRFYIPNQDVYGFSGKVYINFNDMQEDIGKDLENIRDWAFKNDMPFIPYKSYCKPMPKYAEELKVIAESLPEEIEKLIKAAYPGECR